MERQPFTLINRNNRQYRVRYGGTAHLRYLTEQPQTYNLGDDFRRLPNGRVMKSKSYLNDIKEQKKQEYNTRRLNELRESHRKRQELKKQRRQEEEYNASRLSELRESQRVRHEIRDRLSALRGKKEFSKKTPQVYKWVWKVDESQILEDLPSAGTDNVVRGILRLTPRELRKLTSNQITHVSFRIVFKTENGNYVSFTVHNIRDKSFEQIWEEYLAFQEKFQYEWEVTQFYFSVIEDKTAGGCDKENTHHFVFNQFYPRCRIWMTSPKSKDNNCLINCYVQALNLKGNKHLSSRVRIECGLPKSDAIEWQDVHKVANYFKVNMELYCHPLAHENDIKDKFTYSQDTAPTVRIHLINGHYFLENNRSSLFVCLECGKGMDKDPKTGKMRMCKAIKENQTVCIQCNPAKRSYFQIVKKKVNMLAKKTKKIQKRVPLENIVFFDLETLQELMKEYSEAYAVGFMRGTDSEPTIYYGKDCLDRFIEFVKSCNNTVFVAFNGARFDHYFLVNRLLKDGVEIATYESGQKKTVLSNGRLLQFEFGENNKVWDLCLFLQSSLEKCGKAFECDFIKGDFNHELIKSWEDVETYRNEVIPYLQKDVLLLKELHIKYSDQVFQTEGLEVTNFMTMPQLSFYAWNLTLTSKAYDIYVNYTLPEYIAFRESRYGGRCYPMRHKYQSKIRDIDWQKIYDSDDFYVAVDIVSQYPAVMAGCELLKTRYPVGQHRPSTNPKEDFEKGLFGMYFIRYTPDKTKSVPVLPKRDKGLHWNLHDGEGWYTNIDIMNAIEFGNYEITFTDRAFVWDETADDLFKEYIDRYFEYKKIATEHKNPVIRSYAKIMMNSLYGKLQQKPFDTENLWSSNTQEIQNFIEGKILDDMFLFEEAGLWMITAKKTDVDLCKSVTKPLHLGAFILSYSRRLYLKYIQAIDPELNRKDIFIYTDTDSFFMNGKDYKKLKELGYFGEELGMLSNDIDNDGLITNFISYAPKTYYGLAVNRNNKIVTKSGLKGIPNKEKKSAGEWIELPRYSEHEPTKVKLENDKEVDILSYFDFLAGTPKPVEFTSFQKIHAKANKQEPFSINIHKTKRTAFKSLWSGFQFDGNNWTPKGYIE